MIHLSDPRTNPAFNPLYGSKPLIDISEMSWFPLSNAQAFQNDIHSQLEQTVNDQMAAEEQATKGKKESLNTSGGGFDSSWLMMILMMVMMMR